MSENTEAQVLEKLQESFCFEAWEKFFDYGMETMKRMIEYTANLETLDTNLKSLTAKASDVDEQIKNGEASGKKKRKREVENWLKEVDKIESELVVLQNEVHEQGFLNQFLGNKDRVERLHGRIRELLEESEYFGELLFDACATSGKPSDGGNLLETLLQSFFSRVREKLAECGWEAVTGNKDPKFSLKTLQRSLKSLSDKACYIKDQIKHGEQSGKMKRKQGVENWLEELTEIESELGALQNEVQEEGFLGRFFGEDGRVSELNARVCELVDQSWHFGELLLVARENRGEHWLTTRLTGRMFEKNIEVIWEWLVNDKVKSIGIYGMGGVGKTTLANHINNRLRNENRRVYWVTVSQVFTTNELQSDIAKVIDLDLSDKENEDKRAGSLNQALSKKEDFVLILDDVWSDIDLEKMGDPLGVEGCRLIVTTRSLSVCQRIDCQEIIKVETLKNDESWTLFRQTLGERMAITSEVEEVAKSLARECDGLPLGIIVLAKSMKGVTDIHEWRNVYGEIRDSPLKFDDMKDKVFRVLKYSFDGLDPKFHENRRIRRRNGYTNLQLCFLYCSLYPKGDEIDKDKLVRKLISEELVDKTSLEKQLEQGYTMLSKLVDLCLLESISGRVKMHDLVRDMALRIARESPKHKVFAGVAIKEIPNEEKWADDVDKISLMDNEIEEIPIGMAPNCPKLATLLLNDNPLESIPGSFFAKMSGLRILDLSDTSIRELPNSLSDLESLNTLLLNNCKDLVSLPFLGKLKALRELDLSWTSIEKMPKGMENLINLEILLLKGAKNLKLQPGDLPIKSRNLQHLEFPLEIEVPVHEIESFKQLNTFVGRFKDISDFNWFQSQTGGLISTFSYIVRNKFHYFDEHLGLNKLMIDGCSLRREGEDSVIILPEKVPLLHIQWYEGLSSWVLDDFKLCSSSVIEDLKIDDCAGIESIWNINDQLIAETTKKIRFVCLQRLPDLKCLVNCAKGGLGRLPCPPPQAVMIFSSLEILSICHCDKMKKLGLPLPCLRNITRIDVKNCAEIEELLELDKDYEEISEPTHSLPKLKHLFLTDLPKLKSICKARIDCKFIEGIWIWGSPRVKMLPLFLPSSSGGGVINNYRPPALKEIRIERELWESLEWDDDIRDKHLLQPFVKFR